MNVHYLRINDLFGSFNHRINFRSEEGITLILGQNGLGKTVILNILKYIFEGDFLSLDNIEFSKIELGFSNGEEWIFERALNENKESELRFISKNEIKTNRIDLSEITENLERITKNIRRYLGPRFRRLDDDEWYDRKTEKSYSSKDIYVNFKGSLPEEIFEGEIVYPEWFSTIADEVNVEFIQTQRLITFSKNDDSRVRPSLSYKKTVKDYSEHLVSLIKNRLANSSEEANRLDRTFPSRLIKRLTEPKKVSQEQINEKLSALEEKRNRFEAVGLLDLEKEPVITTITKEQEPTIREVLLVYIEDSDKKLAEYDQLADKIELLRSIINNRFLRKELFIDREQGMVLKSSEGTTIDVEDLSSGEQHLLVLYYRLLFKIRPGSLVLIDEPEISLHISWQKKIISDLKRIIRLTPMSLVIATHSPAVIGSNWDLAEELKVS